MKTAAVLICLVLAGCLQARTSLAIADQVTGRLASGLHSIQLDAAADAVLYPARMVRLADGEGGRAAPQSAAHFLVRYQAEPQSIVRL